MQFTVRHVFDTDVDTYWSKIFFDRDYNRRLYQEVLKFKGYEVLEMNDLGGGAWSRRLRMEPGFDAPAAMKKVIGDRLTYVEAGRFDPTQRRWRYEVTPSVLPDKVTIRGELWTEPRGPKQVERIANMEITIKIFGVGGMVEGHVEKQTRESYDRAARYTADYIREMKL